MNKEKITIEEVRELYDERENLTKHVSPPKPDPAVWPPEGYCVHPQDPTLVYKVVKADVLRAELFDSPEKTAWIKQAKQRLVQIDKVLTDFFFPSPKDEGQQRKTKQGFITSLKTGLTRDVDAKAVGQILNKCGGEANEAINWVPKLRLKEYRELSDELKEVFDNCLVVKPQNAKFDIVAKPTE